MIVANRGTVEGKGTRWETYQSTGKNIQAYLLTSNSHVESIQRMSNVLKLRVANVTQDLEQFWGVFEAGAPLC